ncbi:MAG: COX15/CtaA family protein [Myxococcota bacterium]|nr:COX15/CtaA family protein [Myxococcota bacterium]
MSSRFAPFAWSLLGYDVGVAAWGGYVRASGSGAGCGSHWPLCNGKVMPRAPRVETLVELSHRLSSGVALLLTIGLLGWAMSTYPRGHLVRRGATAAAGFMISEALIGAGLVLFALVAHDASTARALSVALHLVNTLLLLASTALTAFWASPRSGEASDAGRLLPIEGPLRWAVGLPLVGTLLVAASGTVTALGDTLFPASSIAAGFGEDFAPGAHVFVRIRALHPVLAVMTAAGIVFASAVIRSLRPTGQVRLLSRAAAALAIGQVLLGVLDVLTLAPIWIQLVHLVLADMVWIALVLTTASALGEARRPRPVPAALEKSSVGAPS